MPDEHLMRWPDLVVIGVNFTVMVAIGVYCARKTRSADAYFLANRSLPGWVVAVSLMATVISSMTFLALPGSSFTTIGGSCRPTYCISFPALSPNVFLLLLGYNLSFVLRRPTDKPLTDLTIWTKTK